MFRYLCCWLLTVASCGAMVVSAAPISLESVQKLAHGVAASVQVSSKSGRAVRVAQSVSRAEVTVSAVAAANASETAFYVIDRGSAGGFVVMSADDRLDAVLVIAPTGTFDSTPGTPLYDILCGDVRQRVVTAEKTGVQRSDSWRTLLDEADSLATSRAYANLSSITDVRVAPLVKSQWDQSNVGSKDVYNYYTPENYVCGCVATAGAQIMRYHQFPKTSVASVTRSCEYETGKNWINSYSYYPVYTTKNFTTYGGTYAWSNMPLVPTSSITETQQKAIGKLCYDIGVSVYMSWGEGGSSSAGYCLKEAFCDVFGYANAMAYQLQNGSLSTTQIKNAVLANFDAGYPVELSIDGSAGGHSIVGDGYGYSGSALYVHLNLGWGGSDDAWYQLPTVSTSQGLFSVVDGAVYNIFPTGTGDLLTGRVVRASDGQPIAGATVQARIGSTLSGSTTTSENGIYALRLTGGKTYTVTVSAAGVAESSKSVTLTASVSTGTEGEYYYPNTGKIGNSWGNDFSLTTSSSVATPVDFGNGITWPLAASGALPSIVFSSMQDGRLVFGGMTGTTGASTSVYVLVKTDLSSSTVYTVPATLRIIYSGVAELDLSSIMGMRPSLFVMGLTTEKGTSLP